jgi:hypothetical protein
MERLTVLPRSLLRCTVTIPRRTAAILLGLALLPASLAGQEPALSETVEVRLIEFDAVVTDRRGNPVPGLGPDDFELLLARRTHVPIHLIAATPDPRFESASGPGSRGMNPGLIYHTLSRMVESTGGSSHRLRRIDELPAVYEQIGAALQAQFLLFVRTEPGKSGNEWRNIRVEMASRGITVHAPEGYYAPW